MNEEILLENTEIMEENTVVSESVSLENETMEQTAFLVDSSESVLDTETPCLESSELANDDSDQGVTGEVLVQYDYTETLSEMNVSLTIIVMILLFWFGMWCLEKWRSWTVKGGK